MRGSQDVGVVKRYIIVPGAPYAVMSGDLPDNEELARLIVQEVGQEGDADEDEVQRLADLTEKTKISEDEINEIIEEADDGEELVERYTERTAELMDDVDPDDLGSGEWLVGITLASCVEVVQYASDLVYNSVTLSDGYI